MSQEDAKQAAALKAAEFVESGMIVGLGTGTTARYFIDRLIEKAKDGLSIQVVASSKESADRAKKGKLKVRELNDVTHVDLTVDGADEIDPQKRMIKGGGGALVREKILGYASHELMIIVDETKCRPRLGHVKLPVEVIFYGSPSTRRRIEKLGLSPTWRMKEDRTLFVTDNGNLILDVTLPSTPFSPEELHEQIKAIPGVVDTGFFFGIAGRVIVGQFSGAVDLSRFST
ncbi:MAG: ribose-5-phosphate isomerase [Chlamydiota bacterium]|jgi:ribose 5-phosphate isomerase A